MATLPPGPSEGLEQEVGATVRRTSRAVAESRKLIESTDRQVESSADRAGRSLQRIYHSFEAVRRPRR
jgi:hypothetical protein